jgi:AraC-like DNA-binding protein
MLTYYSKDYFDLDELPLCVVPMPYLERGSRMHAHDFHELMIVVAGVAIHHVAGENETVSMGDVWYIPPGVAHGYDPMRESGIQVLNVLFDLDKLRINLRDLTAIPGFQAMFTPAIDPRIHHLRLSSRDLAVVTSLVEGIFAEGEGSEPGYELVSVAKFCELMVFISRHYSHVPTAGGQSLAEMGTFVSFIETHIRDDLCLDDLIQASGMSASSLRRKTRQFFYLSPMMFLQKTRLRKAMLLLANPLTSVGEVAAEVGIYDAAYFARVFKKETGVSPTEFRESVGK